MKSTSWIKKTLLIGALAAGLVGVSTAAQAADNCGLGNGKKATGAPILIGAVVGKTGPDDFSAGAKAAAAYFKCVNDNGGINGRPVQYIIADDKWNPEVAAQVAAKLVHDTKVVGMVGSSSFVECSANGKLYDSEDVAVIASVGVPRACFFLKNYAPLNNGPRLSSIGAVQYAVEKNKFKKIACVAPNIPGFGDWSCAGVEAYGKSVGATVKSYLFDPGSMDPNGTMQQVAADKPDVVVFPMARGMAIPLLKAAEQQDMAKTITFVGPTSFYNTAMPKAVGPYWDGRLDVQIELEPMDKAGPDNSAWKAIMAKYGDKGDQIDTFSQAGYLAAKFATKALLGIKGPIDRKTVSAAFRGINGASSDMLCSAWSYGNGPRHNANNQGRMVSMKVGGFNTIPGVSCFQAKDAELADLK